MSRPSTFSLGFTAPLLAAVLPLLVPAAGCLAPVGPSEAEGDASYGRTESALNSAQRRTRAGQIRDAALRVGITEGYLLAGIADAETTMAHCHSELTWACRGPYSADCGGPVVAGAGDGPCSIRQGGLGMFQFDAGNYDQTLAREGTRILSIAGNVEAAVDFVVNMVIRSSFISGVSTRAQAIAWINGVRVNNGRYGAWISTVTRYYNGCPTSGSCWPGRFARYRDHTTNVYNEMGAAFWQVARCEPACLNGSRIRDANCGEGECSAYGAGCVDDALGVRCVFGLCTPRGESKACLDDDQLMTCRDGLPIGTGSCGAFGARCVQDDLGARCVAAYCEPRGAQVGCLDDDQLFRCQDGAISVGSCGAYGATCVDDELGARCASVFCGARGEHRTCIPDSNVLLSCSDGAILENGDCGAFGATCVDDELGARCVSAFCEARGAHDACAPGETRITCDDGGIVDSEDCAAGGGVCVSDGEVANCVTCPAEGTTRRCAGEVAVERCDEGAASVDECPEGTVCSEDGGEARCVGDEPLPAPPPPGPGMGDPDPGAIPDAMTPRGASTGTMTGGCSVGSRKTSADAGLLFVLFGLALLRPRRRRCRRPSLKSRSGRRSTESSSRFGSCSRGCGARRGRCPSGSVRRA